MVPRRNQRWWSQSTQNIEDRSRRRRAIYKVQPLEESVCALLAPCAKAMKKLAFINDISSQNERFLLDRPFHIIFPNMQLIEYNGTPGLRNDDSSLIT